MPPLPPILLVEDNADDVYFMERALKGVDIRHPLHVATSGFEAIEYLSGEGRFADRLAFPLPALVLLDLKLPGKGGHEVLEWIRRRPELRPIVVIVMTTSRERSDVQRAYELGANAYLVKPTGAPALLEQVKTLKTFWLDQNEFCQTTRR
jgi:CheY-like chemotaxis protein